MSKMDSDDFGPMTAADAAAEVGVDELRRQLEESLQREQQLIRERQLSEDEFGQKRAKFMDLFKQKEDALKLAHDKFTAAEQEKEDLETRFGRLKAETDDIQTAAAISEGAKHDEIDEVKRQWQEEVRSLQLIMRDAVNQANEQAAAKYEHDHTQWLHRQEKMEEELEEAKKKLKQERDGFLASVAKSLQKKVGVSGNFEQENLEESMKRAQEDAEVLKSVVMPLEEEIVVLKSKLREASNRLEEIEGKPFEFTDSHGSEDAVSSNNAALLDSADAEEKVKELNKSLETEKASRTDLEMYVAVLNTQKTVLQEDADKLRAQLHEVCRLLEQEKREHTDLKRTWQMANDQFLEAQRLMMMDMRRLETVLSAEQQRQITELKLKDAEREAQEKRVKELSLMREKEQQEQEKRRQAESKRQASLDQVDSPEYARLQASKVSLNSTASEDFKYDHDDPDTPIGLRRSQSNQSFSSITRELLVDSGIHGDSRSPSEEAGGGLRASPEKVMNIPSLTEAQQRAITDPTPEVEASQSLLAHAKAKLGDTISMVGKRLVSEKEWQAIQQEVKASREKVGRPCDMCNNYERQLQAVQDGEKKFQAQVRMLERQLKDEQRTNADQTKYIEELEDKSKGQAEVMQQTISELTTKCSESERFSMDLKQLFLDCQTELHDQLKLLTENREEIHKELKKLQEENDSLVGKHSKHAQQMQEESIDLPNNTEELQLLLLRLREDIITAKVAKEHTEETLRSEILFLKDQVVSEQQEKNTLEETLSQEITQLQEQLMILQSVKSELDHQTALKLEADNKSRDADAALKSIQAKSKQLINALQGQVDEQSTARSKSESEVQQLRAKVTGLQVDLENSEAVQRDFVKLSQSLQIQLEKIRAAEHEVRWQHEEDVDDCANCKMSFSVTKRKHHCKHCGRIFCTDCLTKTVHSGPNLRPSKVCDVCHTILVREATPYFSTEPPQTPD